MATFVRISDLREVIQAVRSGGTRGTTVIFPDKPMAEAAAEIAPEFGFEVSHSERDRWGDMRLQFSPITDK